MDDGLPLNFATLSRVAALKSLGVKEYFSLQTTMRLTFVIYLMILLSSPSLMYFRYSAPVVDAVLNLHPANSIVTRLIACRYITGTATRLS